MTVRYQNKKTKVVYRYIDILEFQPDLAECMTFQGKREYVATNNLEKASNGFIRQRQFGHQRAY